MSISFFGRYLQLLLSVSVSGMLSTLKNASGTLTFNFFKPEGVGAGINFIMCDTSKHVSGPYEQSHGYSTLESNKRQGILNVMR